MKSINRRLGTLLLLFALLGAACSSSSGGSEVSTQADDEQSESASPSEGDDSSAEADEDSNANEPVGGAVEAGATSMAASSPIGAFFSDDGGFEAAVAEYSVRVEEAIVVCMAAQGFEFARSSAFNENEVQDRQNELTLREWTTEYGFGISTSFDSIAQGQAGDPNAKILFSLSPAEQEVWVSTLTGGGFGGIGGDDAPPLEEQGCIGEALIETGGQEAIEGLEEFGSIYEEGEEALFERREMVEVITAWSRCMSEAGFADHGTLDDPEEAITEKFDATIAPMQAALEELSDDEGQALISGESLDIADLPNLDVAALRDLQAEEIELALADLDCYEAEVQAVYEPLRDDFESGLLVEYATEFEAIKNIGS